ncbi:hypothetical protein SCLCIDRAFT_648528 [Scleroderma citrinum Foug A]|uniref:Uncharacterized protein n=1 Tax=Scleroderma citrinum Foug A TaxID=1036808 RepID=A0A0C3AHG7_9AGAM|nr:hypothetical protein SCLCIDRAFT_648528 [Scleroderma citrinum Foug A]
MLPVSAEPYLTTLSSHYDETSTFAKLRTALLPPSSKPNTPQFTNFRLFKGSNKLSPPCCRNRLSSLFAFFVSFFRITLPSHRLSCCSLVSSVSSLPTLPYSFSSFFGVFVISCVEDYLMLGLPLSSKGIPVI